MHNNNIQQWWESTYRHHQANPALEANSFHFPTDSSVIFPSDKTYDESEIGSLKQLTGEDFGGTVNFTLSSSYNIDNEERTIPSVTILFMVISYGLVVFGGVLGNATLVLTLCSASSVRLRNPLLLAVCLADLLVTGISAPVTLLNLAMNRKTKPLPMVICKIIHYVQVMPVAASTISFFMLSLDRYATVKHPRLAQLRQRRYLHVSLALISWITSAAISTPFLFAYKVIAKTVINGRSSHNYANNNYIGFRRENEYDEKMPTITPKTMQETASNSISINCTADVTANTIFVSFIIFHTITVFILPGIGVLLNHYGVRRKLCALSLTARAAHGELPLPMPILRRQTHMVIVTGIANAQQAAGTTDDTSNGGDIQLQHLNPRQTAPHCNLMKSANPISPRAMREVRAHSQRQRLSNNQGPRGPATPGIPLPQTSTLRSRRHLANMLIASALIFIVCWAPHVFCIFYKNLGYKQYCSKTSTYFNLLLGYMYSAISPIIYWALNHNTLRQSPCAPVIRLRSVQNFLRTRFRSHTVPPAPSSTNEAALGAFNPKLIKLTPKQYRAQASSHYLY